MRYAPVFRKPICFATYLIQAQKQKDYQEQFNRMEQDMREWRKWEQRNFMEKILHPKPIRISRTEQATADSLFQNGEQNVRNLRGMIADGDLKTEPLPETPEPEKILRSLREPRPSPDGIWKGQ